MFGDLVNLYWIEYLFFIILSDKMIINSRLPLQWLCNKIVIMIYILKLLNTFLCKRIKKCLRNLVWDLMFMRFSMEEVLVNHRRHSF